MPDSFRVPTDSDRRGKGVVGADDLVTALRKDLAGKLTQVNTINGGSIQAAENRDGLQKGLLAFD